jgi:acyl dehydratase
VSTRTHASVEIGEELPPLDIETTATIVAGGAIASRDYTPVHHDRAAAQAQGLPDIFMNILTTKGFVGRYVTDWSGPDTVVKGVKIKLGGPNLPGHTLKIRGTVSAKDEAHVEIEVAGTNPYGAHVNATVRVALPQ